MNYSEIHNLFLRCEKKFNKICKNKLILIVNLQDYIAPSNSIKFFHANKIECFSNQEYKEIISAVEELKIDYSVYFDEISFINDILNQSLDVNQIIVFNFARNGLKEGKKSLIPSFCDLVGIKYTGSGAFTQSLCRNKFVYNKYLRDLGVFVPKTYALTPFGDWLGDNAPKDLNEIIIKPLAESSSIGVSKVMEYKNLELNNIEFINNQPMLIQEFIPGKEIECPFFIDEGKAVLLPTVELYLKDKQFLDVDTSFNNNYSFSLFNSQKSEELYAIIRKIIAALGLTGYGRIDFRISQEGIPYLFDIATMPFICKHSSFTFSMDTLNYKLSDIYKIILCLSGENK